MGKFPKSPERPAWRQVLGVLLDDLENAPDEEDSSGKGVPALSPIAPSPFRRTKSFPNYGEKRVTTNFRDALGRRVCIVDGRRVSCNTAEEPGNYQPPAEDLKANPNPPAPEAPPQEEVPRRLSLRNLDSQPASSSVLIWTDAGGAFEVASHDAWGKWARWVSSMKDAPAMASFANEGWTVEPGSVLKDFTRLDTETQDPEIDGVTHEVLNAFQNQPDMHLAIVTVENEVSSPEEPSEEELPTPQVKESPFRPKE